MTLSGPTKGQLVECAAVVGRHKSEVDTPAMLLDMDLVEANVATMAEFFSDKDCKPRPHCKTHKLPLIAHKQIEAGAIGITCATLEEAQVMLQSGIDRVLIANEIVSPERITRMVNLSRYGDLIVAVDNHDNAEAVSEAAGQIGVNMSVIVEVNVGLNRCGVAPGEPALQFVQRLSRLDNIVFRGLMGYEGGLFVSDEQEKADGCNQANERLVQTRRLIEGGGIPVEITSAGGSNTYCLTGAYPGITDVQVGSYVTMDTHNRSFGLDFAQALTVMATVISRPERKRAVIDVGAKSISSDAGMPTFLAEGLSLSGLNEEHGHVTIEDPDNDVSVGDKLELIPSHGCTTIPLHDRYVITRDDHVESVAEICARRGFQ